MHTCKKGEIWRVGYTRKTSKKKSKKSKKGIKKVHVVGKCIKATSQTGEKTSVITRQYLDERKRLQKLAREKFGTPKCKKDELVKEGYLRKSKSGSKKWIKPTCVPARGRITKRDRTIYIEPGRLSKYGYDDVEQISDLARHKALKLAMKRGEKPLSVSRRLNALATLTKNTNPKLSGLFKDDSEWIKRTPDYKEERSK